MDRSLSFGSNATDCTPLRTRFRYGYAAEQLNLACDINSLAHYAKGTPSLSLRLLVSARFQDLFHSPQRGSFHLSLTVLIHYRSLGSI
jgi:hypothetical protein